MKFSRDYPTITQRHLRVILVQGAKTYLQTTKLRNKPHLRQKLLILFSTIVLRLKHDEVVSFIVNCVFVRNNYQRMQRKLVAALLNLLVIVYMEGV